MLAIAEAVLFCSRVSVQLRLSYFGIISIHGNTFNSQCSALPLLKHQSYLNKFRPKIISSSPTYAPSRYIDVDTPGNDHAHIMRVIMMLETKLQDPRAMDSGTQADAV
jgi:hypothetical protein